jgi:hypothetical protein
MNTASYQNRNVYAGQIVRVSQQVNNPARQSLTQRQDPVGSQTDMNHKMSIETFSQQNPVVFHEKIEPQIVSQPHQENDEDNMEPLSRPSEQ